MTFDHLNDKFDIASSSTTDIVEYVPKTIPEDDGEFARSTIRELIKKTTEAADALSFIAGENQSAREYEVVGQLLKTASEMASDLLKLQKTKREIERLGGESGKTVTHNNLIVTTQELMKIIQKTKEIESSSHT